VISPDLRRSGGRNSALMAVDSSARLSRPSAFESMSSKAASTSCRQKFVGMLPGLVLAASAADAKSKHGHRCFLAEQLGWEPYTDEQADEDEQLALRRATVCNFLQVPWNLEPLLTFGYITCLDERAGARNAERAGSMRQGELGRKAE